MCLRAHLGHCQKKERRFSSARYCPCSPAEGRSATSSSGCSVSLGVILLLLLSPLLVFNSLVFVFSVHVLTEWFPPPFPTSPHPQPLHPHYARECISREDTCEAGQALRPNHHFTLKLLVFTRCMSPSHLTGCSSFSCDIMNCVFFVLFF